MKGLLYVIWFFTLFLFIVFWWKKRSARKNAGDNYLNDSNYKQKSLIKSIIGWTCLISFVGAICAPIPPEDLARIEKERAEKKAVEQVQTGETKQEVMADSKEEAQKDSDKKINEKDNEKEDAVDNGSLDIKVVESHTLNRTVKQFENKFKEEEFFYQDYEEEKEWINKYGKVRKILVQEKGQVGKTYLYEYINKNDELYMVVLSMDLIRWDSALPRHLLYSIQPEFGPIEVRMALSDITNDKVYEQKNIVYHLLPGDETGEYLFIVANNKLIPKTIKSFNEVKEAVGTFR